MHVVCVCQAREYQAQLIELMKKEAVDEAASEAIRKAEQDKAWRKREEVSKLLVSLRRAYVYVCVTFFVYARLRCMCVLAHIRTIGYGTARGATNT
jgi:hypothetical protein